MMSFSCKIVLEKLMLDLIKDRRIASHEHDLERKRRMRQGQETRRILKMMIYVKKLFQHEEQSHLEPADGLHGVPPCLIKLEGLAGPDVVILSLVADDGFAIQRKDKRFAGRSVL